MTLSVWHAFTLKLLHRFKWNGTQIVESLKKDIFKWLKRGDEMLLKISHEVPIPRGLCHGHSYYLYKRQSYYDTRIHNLRTCLLFGLKLFISQKNNRIICLNENLELLLVIYNVTLKIALDLEEIKKYIKLKLSFFMLWVQTSRRMHLMVRGYRCPR